MNEEALFQSALERPPSERAAFLAAACGGDEALLCRVEVLLRAHENPGSFLQGQAVSAVELDAETRDLRSIVDQPGTQVGPYKLLQRIGEGGMGAVFMAEQTEPVHRIVAVKLIRPGADSRQVLARFEAERQALALMDHPNIARVLDAGATKDGRPFFVMELVKGIPITKYCDDRRLTPRERLALFVPVCQAIQHAHQKGVIHRDIKPSNVLVALYDGRPVPKVIDFGVAKATGQRLTDKTLFTGFGAVVGTLEYMSPEQAETNQLDIDTRSDVYSLGVLLYELLTGTTPLPRKRLREAALLEILRYIREEEPQKPSQRLSTIEELPSIAAARGLEPKRLTGLIRGDLDWIVMKALEKDRVRRYETANGLAVDVERFLADEPVSASPPSALYRLRKFARRNRGPVIAAVLFALALAVGAVGTVLGLVRALEAEELARGRLSALEEANGVTNRALDETRQAQGATAKALVESEESRRQAEAVSEYLVAAFRTPDPEVNGAQVKVVEVLDRAMATLESDFDGPPVVKARLYHTLGETYYGLGLPAKAAEAFEKARANREKALGPIHRETLTSQCSYGAALSLARRESEAWPILEEVLRLARAHLPPDDPVQLQTMNTLAATLQKLGKNAEALRLNEEVYKLMVGLHGSDDLNTLRAENNLALARRAAGEPSASLVPVFERIVERHKVLVPANHPRTLTAKHNLGSEYLRAGRGEDARRVLEEVLPRRVDVLGADHLDTLSTMRGLAETYVDLGQLDEAKRILTDLLAACQRKKGPDAVSVAKMAVSLGFTLLNRRRFAEAEPLLRESMAIYERHQHPDAVKARNYLGFSLFHQRKFDEAEPLFRSTLASMQKSSPDHWETFAAQVMVGQCLVGLKRLVEAEPVLREGYEGLKARAHQIPSRIRVLRLSEPLGPLVGIAKAQSKPDEARKWQDELNRLTPPKGPIKNRE